jgi:lipopolysaccharide biosynthesis regulator YciM
MATTHLRAGDTATAKALLTSLLEEYPDYRDGLDELMKIYIAERDVEAMVNVLRSWVSHNPGDRDVAEALAELVNQLRGSVTGETDSS